MLHQNIQERAKELINNKNEFLKYRNIIFNDFFPKLNNNNYPQFIKERICFCACIIIAIGLISFWDQSIEDLMEYYIKQNSENFNLIFFIFENIHKEFNDLPLMHSFKLRIRDALISKKNIILEFIFLVLNQETLKDNFSTHIFKMLSVWIKLGLNVMFDNKLLETLLSLINLNNLNEITEIFNEGLNNSDNRKYFESADLYDIEEISRNISKEEKENLEKLIIFYKELIISNKDNYLILNNVCSVITTIVDNYPHLLFMVIKL